MTLGSVLDSKHEARISVMRLGSRPRDWNETGGGARRGRRRKFPVYVRRQINDIVRLRITENNLE